MVSLAVGQALVLLPSSLQRELRSADWPAKLLNKLRIIEVIEVNAGLANRWHGGRTRRLDKLYVEIKTTKTAVRFFSPDNIKKKRKPENRFSI